MEMVRRITQWIPLCPRRRGRPNKDWMDEIDKDLRTLGTTDWKSRFKNRAEWRKLIYDSRTTHKNL